MKSDGTPCHRPRPGTGVFGPDGDVVRMIGGMSDMTPCRAAEHELTALNRAFQMLSSCNKLLIREEEEKQLLQEICQVTTRIGGYSVAIVNYADDTPEKRIVPIAQVGLDDHYFFSGSYHYTESAAERSRPRCHCPENRGKR